MIHPHELIKLGHEKRMQIVINSVPRSANTFFLYSLKEAFVLNVPEYYITHSIKTHIHQPVLLRLPNSDSFVQYTMFRNVDTIIPSMVIHRLAERFLDEQNFLENLKDDDLVEEIIEICITQYSNFLGEQLFHNNSNVLMFEDIVTDIHSVLEKVMSQVGARYTNKINVDDVKNIISKYDRMGANFYSNNLDMSKMRYHVPHNIENLPFYHDIVSKINNHKFYSALKDMYKEALVKYGPHLLKEGA